MGLVKPLLFIFLIFFVLNTSFSFTIGVIEPGTTCIKPDRTTIVEAKCQSGAMNFQTYGTYLSGPEFMKLSDSKYLFFPQSTQEIPIHLNTSNVNEGFYSGNFTFCLENDDSLDNETESGVVAIYCINSNIKVNVSGNCPELAAVSAEKGIDFKLAFNITALFLITVLLMLLIVKNILKKRHKN